MDSQPSEEKNEEFYDFEPVPSKTSPALKSKNTVIMSPDRENSKYDK